MQSAAVVKSVTEGLEASAALQAAGLQVADLKNLSDLHKLIAKLVPAANRLAEPDFVDFNDDVILDRSTGLYWHKKSSVKTLNEDGEKAYVADLNARAVGGFSDWTCPSRRQLLTLVNDEAYSPAAYAPFKDNTSTGDYYRTSSALSANPDDRWFVYFLHGYVSGLHRSYLGFVRAVRVASPGQ